MSTAVQGGRPLARFRLLGFPVHLDASFLVVMALFGLISGFGISGMVLWLLITPVAVLVHELGHAVVARSAGGRPAIALAGFGGETTLNLPGPLSRGRSIAISVAGPFVGLAIGGALLVWARVAPPDPYSLAENALTIGLFTTIGWSVLNLLPILPLDGGQTMRELLPGDPERRSRLAAGVSIGTAVIAGGALLWLGFTFAPIFFAWFALSNVMALRRPGPPRPIDVETRPEAAVVQLLWQGRSADARALMTSLPPGTITDVAIHGAVLATNGDPGQGFALLQQEATRRPAESDPIALLVLAHLLRHEWDSVLALLAGPRRRDIPAAVVDRAVAEARAAQAPEIADRIAATAAPA